MIVSFCQAARYHAGGQVQKGLAVRGKADWPAGRKTPSAGDRREG